MSLVQISFNQILTMVIMMFIGFVCAKTRIINEDTNKQISNFVLLVANPLAIFLSYQRPFEIELLGNLGVALILSIISYGIAIVVSQIVYRRRGDKDYAIEKLCCVYPNSGFIGIPLVQGVFGLEGVFYLTAYLTMFNLLVWTHAVIVSSGRVEPKFIQKAIFNVPVLSVFLGLALFLARVSLPEFMTSPMGIMGSTNTPMAMIVAGVSMSRANIMKIVKNYRIYIVVAMRLLIIPAIQIALFTLFDIHPIVLGTILLAASCPPAMTVIFFSYRYNRDVLYASEVFTLGTLLSLATIPLLLMFI